MVVPILANAFGGRVSVGLLLPILIFADLFAVIWYNKHADWKHILRLIPWALAGIMIATFVGKNLSDSTFNLLLAILVVSGIIILIWQDIRSKNENIPKSRWIAATLGLLGGFATMMGNAAGPVMALYLLSMRLPKDKYIGTGAWYALILNWLKIPLFILDGRISFETVKADLVTLPLIAAGAFLGIMILKKIPLKWFNIVIQVLAAATAVRLSLMWFT